MLCPTLVGSEDDQAKGFTQVCLGFFRDCDALSRDTGLRDLSVSCEQVSQECQHVAELLRSREQARQELAHYEEKVRQLQKRGGRSPSVGRSSHGSSDDDDEEVDAVLLPASAGRPTARLSRNLEKLVQSRADEKSMSQLCDSELRAFGRRRTSHSRAVCHGLLRSYVRLLADWGRQSRAVAAAFDQELQPGTAVRVAGVAPSSPDSDEQDSPAIVEGLEPGTGRCVVSLPSGERLAVRPELLRPLAGEIPWSLASKDFSSVVAAGQVVVIPAAAPCGGAGIGMEVEVRCGGLDAQISEVLVDGEPAEILSASSWRAWVRLPPRRRAGPARVEVRTDGWQQRLAGSVDVLQYFEPVCFGPKGQNIELSFSASLPQGLAPTVATRTSGLLHGLVLTSIALPDFTSRMPSSAEATASESAAQKLPAMGHMSSASTTPMPVRLRDASPARVSLPAPDSSHEHPAPADVLWRHFFEVEILDAAERSTGTSRTLSVGFVWPPTTARTTTATTTTTAPTAATATATTAATATATTAARTATTRATTTRATTTTASSGSAGDQMGSQLSTTSH
ncbi:unnamed protein product, partial [Polarella glacialis]